MKVLVGYESKYGATAAIAERIAAKLRERGLAPDLLELSEVRDPTAYDAFVVGSAVYIGSWMKDATRFVERNRPTLASHPLWLFSSGPISAVTSESHDRELRTTAVRGEIAALKEELGARDHHVFFGSLEREKLRMPDRLIAALPAFPGSFGDFRDWSEIDAWSTGIASELAAPREADHADAYVTTV